MKTNIILIGMRGSGKSTLGRQLAKNLNRKFIETDALIEQMVGKSITDIVAQDGWRKFRAIEKKVCEAVCHNVKNTVIATGGGVVLDQENITRLKSIGKIVYLKTPIETLIKRLEKDVNRPSLTGATDIKTDMETTFKQRKHLYQEAADFIIDTSGITIKEIVEELYQL